MPRGPEGEPWSDETRRLVESACMGLETVENVPARQWFEQGLESLPLRSHGAVRKLASDVLRAVLDADEGLEQRITDECISFGPDVPGFDPDHLVRIVPMARLILERAVDGFRVAERKRFLLRPELPYADWVAMAAQRVTVDVANLERQPDWRAARLADEGALERLYAEELPRLTGWLVKNRGSGLAESEIDAICHKALRRVVEERRPVPSPRGLLYRVARNLAIDEHRRHQRDHRFLAKMTRHATTQRRGQRTGSVDPAVIVDLTSDATVSEAQRRLVDAALWRGIETVLGREGSAPSWWSPDLRARSAETDGERARRDRHARNARSAAVFVLQFLGYEFDPRDAAQPEHLSREAVRDQFTPKPNDQGVQRSYQDVTYAVWCALLAVHDELAGISDEVAWLTIQWRMAQLKPVAKLLKSGFPARDRDGGYAAGDAPDRMEARARWLDAAVDDLMGLPHRWTSVVLAALEAPLLDLEAFGRATKKREARESVIDRANACYDHEDAEDEVHRKANAVIEAHSILLGAAELLGGR